ncbi:poly [ADP-ribose] polymerase tankyrase-1-like isoform X2 [Uloborus diversus]|uniref:poly [ADP-ribose] polymerase tankyrase-1-like isoform X2 n=1 Tax=Uloborus diversus TaxID=327109 RepID=UPI00240A9647|nr:poly [ADP-ribose] polymerase tankyrase-1-like isoform X2 [Uloborus diversus]XP_054717742.1 poly [ADP-ribose] polymerase tankyrase-1-like isoform X2 [Uloborus diversus]XP_054717749.1 poly [ADP-ribose] polymerase tankyrase-1-like isoform X2 [Uloborus diversus]XP_054717756.1 poly [ADP-ribose] polymerase tankyrase-1-like isoform X2 [Uloborus diversus]
MNSPGNGSGVNRELRAATERQSEEQSPRKRQTEPGGTSERNKRGRAAKDEDVKRARTEGLYPWRDERGLLPLLLALDYGEEAKAEILLETATDLNSSDCCGRTPLHFTAKKGHLRIIQKLLARGADVRLKDENGRTPLHYAVLYEQEAAAELLLECVDNLDDQDKDSEDVLVSAINVGSVPMAKKLLFKGVGPHKTEGCRGEALVFYALRLGNNDFVKAIVATLAWRGIELYWEDLKRMCKDTERCIRLFSECEAEIRRMKGTWVEGSRLFFYDIARLGKCRLARRLSDEAIRRLLLSDRVEREFPNYGDLLALKLGEVKERRDLVGNCVQCFSLLAPPLPLTCTDIIVHCLADYDLRSFIHAFQ